MEYDSISTTLTKSCRRFTPSELSEFILCEENNLWKSRNLFIIISCRFAIQREFGEFHWIRDITQNLFSKFVTWKIVRVKIWYLGGNPYNRDQIYPDYRFVLRTKSRLRIRIHDGFKIDQDLSYSFSFIDNSSSDKIKKTDFAL